MRFPDKACQPPLPDGVMWTAGVPIIRFVVGVTGAEVYPFISQGSLLGPPTIRCENITDATLD